MFYAYMTHILNLLPLLFTPSVNMFYNRSVKPFISKLHDDISR